MIIKEYDLAQKWDAVLKLIKYLFYTKLVVTLNMQRGDFRKRLFAEDWK